MSITCFTVSPPQGVQGKGLTLKGFDKTDGWCLFFGFRHLVIFSFGMGQKLGVVKRWKRELRTVRLQEQQWCNLGGKKKKKKNKRVMRPTACQRCPLEMINGHRLWWTEPERESECLLFSEITSRWGGVGVLKPFLLQQENPTRWA